MSSLLLPAGIAAYLLSAGLFALSGALTNWLAVHMLFERVPGFYGSGVIPLHFEEFKSGIRELIMQQFFSRENINDFLAHADEISTSLDDKILQVIDEIDLTGAFDSLLDVIMSSSFASMLGFIGGREALLALREPFIDRMRNHLRDSVDNETFKQVLNEGLGSVSASEGLRDRIELIVDHRLQELTPEMVKRIVQQMIREHLGWLVVWGGVLGAVMGFLVGALNAQLL
ncbi:MAG: hypothetical protein RQ757_01985 [Pseudomonadales bacterium]|nr:hypothetical protein [Pseudomonadales bacterium]